MRYVSGFFVVFFILLADLCFAEIEPVVTQVKPLTQKPGQTIRIFGENLLLTTSVRFDSYASPEIDFISNREIEITVPLPSEPQGSGPWRISSLFVTGPTGRVQFSKSEFTIQKPDPPPHIRLVSPNVGSRKGGETITLHGSSFSPKATVKFGELPCSNIQWLNASTLQCQSPGHSAGPVDIHVKNPDLQQHTLSKGFFFAWTRRLGFQHAISQSEKMAMDSQGNTYVVAEYKDAEDGRQLVPSQSSFLFKLKSNGEELWRAQIKDSDNLFKVSAISVAADGAVFLTGDETFSKDNSRLSTFLAKYSSEGEPIWLRTYFNNTDKVALKKGPIVESMVLDKLNNIYLIGSTDWNLEDQASFNGWKAFISKFNESGELISNLHEGQSNPNGYVLVLGKSGIIDSQGDLVVAGMSSTALNEDSLGAVSLLFIAKYKVENDGKLKRVWLKKIQETDPTSPLTLERISIVKSKTDQLVIFSKYKSVNYISSSQNHYTLNSLSIEGERSFSTVVNASKTNISLQDHVIDSKGNIYLIGKSAKGCELSNLCTSSDLFLMKYDLQGNKVWERTHFSTASAEVRSGIYSHGAIYAVGTILGELDNYPSQGQKDTLLCRFDTDGNLR